MVMSVGHRSLNSDFGRFIGFDLLAIHWAEQSAWSFKSITCILYELNGMQSVLWTTLHIL